MAIFASCAPQLPAVVAASLRALPDLAEVRVYGRGIDPELSMCRLLTNLHGVRLAHAEGSVEQTVAGCDAVIALDDLSAPALDEVDEMLPARLGLPGGPRVGPGAVLRAVRRGQHLVRVARAMEHGCPNATLVIAHDPADLLLAAVRTRTRTRALGITGAEGRELAALGACEPAALHDVRYRVGGVGPLGWYDDIRIDGEPVPTEPAEVRSPAEVRPRMRCRFRLSRRLAARIGHGWPAATVADLAFPSRIAANRLIQGGPTRWLDRSRRKLRRRFRRMTTARALGFDHLAQPVAHALAALLRRRPTHVAAHVWSADLADVDPDPLATVVRARLRLDGEVWTRTPPGEMPAAFAHTALDLMHVQALAAAAIDWPSREAVVDALTADPLVPDGSLAGELADRARTAYLAARRGGIAL